LHSLVRLAVGHDASRDQPGDLAHQYPTTTGLDANRHLLVLETRLVGGGVEELSFVVMHVFHDTVDRIPVHVHVEDVHEDRQPYCGTLNETRLVHFGDHYEFSVGGRNDQGWSALAGALGIAEKVGD